MNNRTVSNASQPELISTPRVSLTASYSASSLDRLLAVWQIRLFQSAPIPKSVQLPNRVISLLKENTNSLHGDNVFGSSNVDAELQTEFDMWESAGLEDWLQFERKLDSE